MQLELLEIKKQNYLLDLYHDEFNNMKYIMDQLKQDNYSILPETIAQGIVYKITYEGDLKEDGYEKGFLYIPAGSGIKKHTHTNDIEEYTLVCGDLSVDNIVCNDNRCFINDSHNIDITSKDTIIRTLKISKKLIDEHDYSDIKIKR